MAEAAEQGQLAELIAQASLQYSLKNYDAAAELYSEATALQAELNGEMAPENADLLYAYGRCLYHVGVANSNVLGGKVAGEKPSNESAKPKKKKSSAAASAAAQDAVAPSSEAQKVAEEIVTKVVEEKDGLHQEQPPQRDSASSTTANKPYFQFTGDENWDSDESDAEDGEEDEDADGEADAEADAEDDDFATAYEILDLARVLLLRKIEAIKEDGGAAAAADQTDESKDKGKGKGKDIGEQEPESEEVKQIKERLADTHDLQAEISLENERFTDAVTDSRAALDLKRELFPPESSLLAEAHFKLALALEFASVTAPAPAADDDNNHAAHSTGEEAQQVDMAMREDAAKEMEAAIESCRLRVKKEEASLRSDDTSPAEKEKLKRGIADVKDMIQEMEQRLQDLRQPPISLSSSGDLLRSGGSGPAGAPDPTDADPLTGILGAVLGESAAEQHARVTAASASARDLTGMVRKKKRSLPSSSSSAPEGQVEGGSGGENGHGAQGEEEVESGSASKKAKK
ncbi:hypothetical protein L228DRAFT_270850 [Xylona heveae TC161]|uniref:Tetratricopeptide SHNi-TPR domain-containing protein n=1 Tax=Xylona heveae (strain CBS 132557 / TC161) TaxID=1328760 RepID=A0A165A8K6_XYLHT|nr:hypothetical protein L228DRAFT_270850 [Xylona heveae TC161]KZF20097.1 hypothetical protein L228DRAFT_270850 [Xylona heveae TC161]